MNPENNHARNVYESVKATDRPSKIAEKFGIKIPNFLYFLDCIVESHWDDLTESDRIMLLEFKLYLMRVKEYWEDNFETQFKRLIRLEREAYWALRFYLYRPYYLLIRDSLDAGAQPLFFEYARRYLKEVVEVIYKMIREKLLYSGVISFSEARSFNPNGLIEDLTLHSTIDLFLDYYQTRVSQGSSFETFKNILKSQGFSTETINRLPEPTKSIPLAAEKEHSLPM